MNTPAWFLRIATCLSLALGSGCDQPVPPNAGPVVQITAVYPAADAQVMADRVAAPIEQSVNGVEWQVRLESETRRDGTYLARVFLEPEADLKLAAILVQNRVSQVLPLLPELVRQHGVEVKRLESNVPTPGVTVVLFDRQNAERAALRRWAQAVAVRFAAAGITASAKPDPVANDVPQVRLLVDRGQCARLGVSYDRADQVLRSAGPQATAETLQQAEVQTKSGEKIPLTDVATIQEVAVPALICHYNLREAYYFSGAIPAGKTAAETAAAWRKLAEEVRPVEDKETLQAETFVSP